MVFIQTYSLTLSLTLFFPLSLSLFWKFSHSLFHQLTQIMCVRWCHFLECTECYDDDHFFILSFRLFWAEIGARAVKEGEVWAKIGARAVKEEVWKGRKIVQWLDPHSHKLVSFKPYAWIQCDTFCSLLLYTNKIHLDSRSRQIQSRIELFFLSSLSFLFFFLFNTHFVTYNFRVFLCIPSPLLFFLTPILTSTFFSYSYINFSSLPRFRKRRKHFCVRIMSSAFQVFVNQFSHGEEGRMDLKGRKEEGKKEKYLV